MKRRSDVVRRAVERDGRGAIGDEFGGWEEADYSGEYWRGDPPALARPAAMTEFLNSLPRRDRRDALRALRGSVLRTELYALDGTDRQRDGLLQASTAAGESSPLGLEVDLGAEYKVYRNFDLGFTFGYLFPGSGLGVANPTGPFGIRFSTSLKF